MVCKWIFEKSMLETSYHERMDHICKELGIPYQILTYIPIAATFGEAPFVEDLLFPENDCVVSYGSIEAINGISYYNKKYIPGAYMQEDKLACRRYMPKLPKNDLLNENYIMLPYAEFIRSKETIYNLMETNKLFIRPDSGLKTFAGTTIHKDDFEDEINSLEQLTSVMDDTIVLISRIQPIEKEYRVVVGNGNVIASSLYKIKDEVVMKEGAPKEVIDLASKIAKQEWQPDLVYTCDIAILTNGDVKIIELNSFSCAGLYACNLRDVIIEVSKIAEMEFNREIELIG